MIETGEDNLERARLDGADTFSGNAADPEILAAADLAAARRLFVTIPEPFEAGQVVEQARALNPTLDILARAHSDAAVEHLSGLGASLVVSGEREIAERMIERARGAVRLTPLEINRLHLRLGITPAGGRAGRQGSGQTCHLVGRKLHLERREVLVDALGAAWCRGSARCRLPCASSQASAT